MKTQDWLLCIIVLIVWSSSSALVSIFTKGVNPFVVAGIVVFISAAVLSVLSLYRDKKDYKKEYDKKEIRKLIIPAILGLFLYPISYFIGISGTAPIKANVLNYLWPIIAVISSRVIYKHKFDLVEQISVLTAFIGAFIVLLFNEPLKIINYTQSDFWYALVALAGAVFYGVYTSTIESSVPKRKESFASGDGVKFMPVRHRMSIMVRISAVLYIPVFVFLLFNSPNEVYSTISILATNKISLFALIVYSCVNFTIAHLLWNKINTESNITITSSIAYLIPLFSTIILSYISQIPLGTIPVIGLIIVVSSIVLNNRNNINSINATLVGIVIVLILLKITPVITNTQLISNSQFFLEVVIAIYAIYNGFVMNRVISEYKRYEEVIDFILLYKTKLEASNKEAVHNLEKKLISPKNEEEKFGFISISTQLIQLFPNSLSEEDKRKLFEYYHTLYRDNDYALSPSEWIVISLLSVLIIVLCFIIRTTDLVSIMFTTSIFITVCLFASLLYEYELKRKLLTKKLEGIG